MTATFLAALLAILTAAPAAAEGIDERIAIEPGGLLEVDLDLGDGMRPDPGSIEVVSHDSDEVRIRADVSGWGAPSVEFRLDRGESAVRLFGRVGGAFSWMFGGPSVRLRIWVPRRFSVDLRCTGGPIRVEEIGGEVRARTLGGAIEAVSVEGPVTLRTEVGNVRVSDVTGDVRVNVLEGDIDVSWIRGPVELRTGDGGIMAAHLDGSLSARSDDGDVEVRGMDGRVDAKSERGGIAIDYVSTPAGSLETRRGSVSIVIPADAGANLDAVTREGAIEFGPGVKLDGDNESGHAAGRVNGGGEPLHIYTARGGITVRRR